MRQIYKLLMTAAFVMTVAGVFAQGTTTAGMNGKVTDASGTALTGATVLAVEAGTGAQYGTITDDRGFYRLPNMNPGGPYKFTVTFVGFQTYEKTDIYLTLGQTLKIDVGMNESATQLGTVEIVGSQNDIFDGNRTGAETYISTATINQMPTLGRQLGDYIRLTPQASFREGGISIAGANNRYNAISIDGAVNNDVFGLAATGTNGGQTGGTPISMDVIEQFQVQMAPYDVRQSGFSGASINAVTRRGKNNFEGTAYFFMQNEAMAGKTPYAIQDVDSLRTKLADFSDYIYGLSVGGPIVKDKVFFFLNGEFQRKNTPVPYDFEGYQGDASTGDLDDLASMLNSRFGYDPGGYLNSENELKSNKIFARVDWNINKIHKAMFRHSYVYNNAIQPYTSTNQRIYFYNAGQQFPSTTNSTSFELKSNWDKFNNNLIIGYTSVVDDRDPLGSNFPSVIIKDGGADIYLGSEPFSTANKLEQRILTVNDNFSYYLGAHTLTVGINHEYYNTYNLFVRQNFGEYRYASLDDFMTVGTEGEVSATEYNRTYSLVDDITGDGSAAAADFKVMQWGAYIQDEWQATPTFKLTVGLRGDLPMFRQDPLAAPGFDTVITKIENTFDPAALDENGNAVGAYYDMQGAQPGKMPKTQFMFSPRVGFNWDVNGDQTTQIRGGAGIFMSRLPLVWPGGSYTNNGVTTGGVRYRLGTDGEAPIAFNSAWDAQYTYTDFYGGSTPSPTGQVDLFVEDFKWPQVFRTSIAIDQKLPWGLIGTAELMFTKNLNNVIYYNYNVVPASKQLTMGPDNRWMPTGNRIETRYDRIMIGANTSQGYGMNFTAMIQKNYEKGFQGAVAYTFGRSKSVNDGLSSQNSSQWRYVPNVNGRNNLELSYSNFDLGSRIYAFIGYKKEYAKYFASGISIFYDGVSGKRYSYSYDNSRVINGEATDDYALIWIPESREEINLVDWVSGGEVVRTADEQWDLLNQFLDEDPYLSDNRGSYAERNGGRLPFESYLDLRFLQDFYINAGKTRHTLQISLDFFNFLNMLNKEWGVHRFVNFDNYELIRLEGLEEDGTTPKFTYRGGAEREGTVWNISDPASRWRMQLGIRYIFGTNAD